MIVERSQVAAEALFPIRVPEKSEAMTPEESASLAAWQESPQGRGVYAALAAHVANRLGVASGRIISVGEGEGLFAAELARVLPGCEVIGTDICPEVVRRARARHLTPNLRFETLPVHETTKLAPAAGIVSVFALHHFHDARAALGAAIEALIPGGALYVHDLRRDACALAFEAALDAYRADAPAVAPLFHASVRAAYTTSELAALLRGSGATYVDVRRFRFEPVALTAFERAHPDAGAALPATLAAVHGLWQEGLARRPR